MLFIKLKQFGPIVLTLLVLNGVSVAANNGCLKPKCFQFLRKNASVPIKVYASDTTETTLCFEGLQESLINLWANPVLKIKRKDPVTEGSTLNFVSYYGESVQDVENKKQQPGYVILQRWISWFRSQQPAEDLSLNPFNMSCYIIETNVDYTAHVKIKAADLWYIAYLILGVIIFFSAKSWSLNTSLHYGTGVSVGVLASILILVFIVTKFLPGKLKNLGYILMFFGTSVSLFFLTSLNNFIKDPVTNTFVEHWQYFVGYIVISGLLSFALVYRYGPVTDARTLSLIQWFLQGIGLVLVYNSTQIREVSIALILILLTVYNFPRKLFFCERIRNRWYRFFPPKIKLLTEEEYIRQGNIETNKELEKLRAFCRSPECQSWKIISKLKSPQRFAEFVIQGAWHISATEIMDYEHGDYMDTSDNEAPSDSESELVFVLGSTDRTVKI